MPHHHHAYEGWREEQRSAYLYRVIADAETDPIRKHLFSELAEAALKQAALWEAELQKSATPPVLYYRPDLRSRLVGVLVRYLGVNTIKPVLSAMKIRGMAVYTRDAPDHHPIPDNIEDIGQHHQVNGHLNLRAAVFGINDGLISNASLILGMSGATSGGHNRIVLIAGLAGLLAGAFSMASGEYVSVRSQREMYEHQIELEREELAQYPEEEAAEVALIYVAKGMNEDEARRAADKLIADPDRALDILAREELGLNPNELDSPWSAALSSFLAFCAGAGIPLLPLLFDQGRNTLNEVMAITSAALFLVGASISLFTGRHALTGGLRMLLIGGAAGAASFYVGHALGVKLN
ncbi:MAG: VIT1/CCC1 transporter family protein [Burkholderiales bacterium]